MKRCVSSEKTNSGEYAHKKGNWRSLSLITKKHRIIRKKMALKSLLYSNVLQFMVDYSKSKILVFKKKFLQKSKYFKLFFKLSLKHVYPYIINVRIS